MTKDEENLPCTHTAEYRRKSLPFMNIWSSLRDIMLGEMTQKEDTA